MGDQPEQRRRPFSRRRFLTKAGAAGAVTAAAALSGRVSMTGPSARTKDLTAALQPQPAAAAVPAGLATYHCALGAATLAPDAAPDDALLHPPAARPAQAGRVRRFELTVTEQDIEVARGKTFKAWCFNGTVPGPVIRVTQGDTVEVTLNIRTTIHYTVHFHGIHPASVDGVEPYVQPNSTYVYRFEAQPFGLFVYHCHMLPLEDHINHGMYGVFIIDPPEPRPAAQELVMLMNGYDLEGKLENQFYSINGPAGYYACHPIDLRVNQLVRVYLANMTEFDPINSLHLHANVFRQIASVTALDSSLFDDTVMLCQGQRAIVEFTYTTPGTYMTHAHQADIAEKGWSAFFNVT